MTKPKHIKPEKRLDINTEEHACCEGPGRGTKCMGCGGKAADIGMLPASCAA